VLPGRVDGAPQPPGCPMDRAGALDITLK
jgi:hypothetical protein